MEFINRRVPLLVAAAILLTGMAAIAAPTLKLTLSQSLVREEDGKSVEIAVPSTGATYGEHLRYTIVALNTGDRPALQVQPIGKIPQGTVYVAGSARPQSGLEYSLDGKRWSSKPMVTVRTSDGKNVQEPAPASTFRAVRWSLPQILPKRSEQLVFEVIVK